MTRDRLKVGKKYYNQIGIVEVLYIGNQRVFYRYDVDNAEGSVYIEEFLENCEPVKEKKNHYIVTYQYENMIFLTNLCTSKDAAEQDLLKLSKDVERKNCQLHTLEIEVEE